MLDPDASALCVPGTGRSQRLEHGSLDARAPVDDAHAAVQDGCEQLTRELDIVTGKGDTGCRHEELSLLFVIGDRDGGICGVDISGGELEPRTEDEQRGMEEWEHRLALRPP
jgi:hypothetical protein